MKDECPTCKLTVSCLYSSHALRHRRRFSSFSSSGSSWPCLRRLTCGGGGGRGVGRTGRGPPRVEHRLGDAGLVGGGRGGPRLGLLDAGCVSVGVTRERRSTLCVMRFWQQRWTKPAVADLVSVGKSNDTLPIGSQRLIIVLITCLSRRDRARRKVRHKTQSVFDSLVHTVELGRQRRAVYGNFRVVRVDWP